MTDGVRTVLHDLSALLYGDDWAAGLPSIVAPTFIGLDLASDIDVTGYAVTNSKGACIESGTIARMSEFACALLFGSPSDHHGRGLLGQASGQSSTMPVPPGTMIRQRRRAEARSQAKNA